MPKTKTPRRNIRGDQIRAELSALAAELQGRVRELETQVAAQANNIRIQNSRTVEAAIARDEARKEVDMLRAKLAAARDPNSAVAINDQRAIIASQAAAIGVLADSVRRLVANLEDSNNG